MTLYGVVAVAVTISDSGPVRVPLSNSVTVKVAVRWPAGTVTVAGTHSSVESLELERDRQRRG